MKYARFYGIGDIRIEEGADLEPGDGEAILKVRAVGVCPTDVKAYYSGSSSIKVPIVLGHEVSGTILSSGTEQLNPGLKVNVAADCPCLECGICRRGLVNMCPNMLSLGVNVPGGYAETMRIPSEFIEKGLVYPLTGGTGFVEGALIEPVAVSLHCLNLADYASIENAAVIGDGPNALIHLQLLKRIKRVKNVTVIGLSENRLKFATRFGADHVVNISREKNFYSEMKKEQIDLVDITIGNPEAAAESSHLLGKGTQILIFGGSMNDTQIPVSMNGVHYKQLRVTGSTGTDLKSYSNALDLVKSGKIDLVDLITARFRLEDLASALDYSRNLRGLKCAVEFPDG